MAEKAPNGPSELATRAPPETHVMPAAEAKTRYNQIYSASRRRIDELQKMGITARSKGRAVELTNSDGIKLSASLGVLYDDTVYRSFVYGFRKTLYDAEIKKITTQAALDALNDALSERIKAAQAAEAQKP